jgi:hypothetical protein
MSCAAKDLPGLDGILPKSFEGDLLSTRAASQDSPAQADYSLRAAVVASLCYLPVTCRRHSEIDLGAPHLEPPSPIQPAR